MSEPVAAAVNEEDEKLLPIAALCDGQVKRMQENGRRYIYMEKLRFLVRDKDRVQHKDMQMDALLCLNHPNPTYPTKLFLPENLGLGLNWNENPFILGRAWATWSWRDVLPNQDPIDILAAHLKAFQ